MADKEFRVTFRETVCHDVYVKASNEEEAEKKAEETVIFHSPHISHDWPDHVVDYQSESLGIKLSQIIPKENY